MSREDNVKQSVRINRVIDEFIKLVNDASVFELLAKFLDEKIKNITQFYAACYQDSLLAGLLQKILSVKADKDLSTVISYYYDDVDGYDAGTTYKEKRSDFVQGVKKHIQTLIPYKIQLKIQFKLKLEEVKLDAQKIKLDQAFREMEEKNQGLNYFCGVVFADILGEQHRADFLPLLQASTREWVQFQLKFKFTAQERSAICAKEIECVQSNSSKLVLLNFVFDNFFMKNLARMEVFQKEYPVICYWINFNNFLSTHAKATFTDAQVKAIEPTIFSAKDPVALLNHILKESDTLQLNRFQKVVIRGEVCELMNNRIMNNYLSNGSSHKPAMEVKTEKTEKVGDKRKSPAPETLLFRSPNRSPHWEWSSPSNEPPQKRLKNEDSLSPSR